MKSFNTVYLTLFSNRLYAADDKIQQQALVCSTIKYNNQYGNERRFGLSNCKQGRKCCEPSNRQLTYSNQRQRKLTTSYPFWEFWVVTPYSRGFSERPNQVAKALEFSQNDSFEFIQAPKLELQIVLFSVLHIVQQAFT